MLLEKSTKARFGCAITAYDPVDISDEEALIAVGVALIRRSCCHAVIRVISRPRYEFALETRSSRRFSTAIIRFYYTARVYGTTVVVILLLKETSQHINYTTSYVPTLQRALYREQKIFENFCFSPFAPALCAIQDHISFPTETFSPCKLHYISQLTLCITINRAKVG